MLYRILENKFSSDGTSDFIPQFFDQDDEKFDQAGQPLYRGFYVREMNNLHTLIKYKTIGEAQTYITADKRLHEIPSEVIVHPIV